MNWYLIYTNEDDITIEEEFDDLDDLMDRAKECKIIISVFEGKSHDFTIKNGELLIL